MALSPGDRFNVGQYYENLYGGDNELRPLEESLNEDIPGSKTEQFKPLSFDQSPFDFDYSYEEEIAAGIQAFESHLPTGVKVKSNILNNRLVLFLALSGAVIATFFIATAVERSRHADKRNKAEIKNSNNDIAVARDLWRSALTNNFSSDNDAFEKAEGQLAQAHYDTFEYNRLVAFDNKYKKYARLASENFQIAYLESISYRSDINKVVSNWNEYISFKLKVAEVRAEATDDIILKPIDWEFLGVTEEREASLLSYLNSHAQPVVNSPNDHGSQVSLSDRTKN